MKARRRFGPKRKNCKVVIEGSRQLNPKWRVAVSSLAYVDPLGWIGVLPLKGAWVLGVELDIAHEFASKIFDGGEYAACDHVAFDPGKPDLHLVQPGGIGGCEVQFHVRM